MVALPTTAQSQVAETLSFVPQWGKQQPSEPAGAKPVKADAGSGPGPFAPAG